jgi:hypothetical protein
MMQKYQTVPKTTFCNFCKSVGHEDKDCRTLEIMKERTSYAYRVQDEHDDRTTCTTSLQFGAPTQYNNAQQFGPPPQYNNAQP